jgi:CubicO group peptidase (beta-lactamase class C family)
MKRSLVAVALVACSSKPAPIAAPVVPEPATDTVKTPEPPAPDVASTPPLEKEVLDVDAPRTTVAGNSFIVPAGWAVWVQGPATIVETPEGDSRIALVDVKAKDSDAAVELAWAAYKPAKTWPLLTKVPAPDKDGWSQIMQYPYQTSPNEKRSVAAVASYANDTWTVVLVDVADATGEKRGGQFGLIFGQLLPKGGQRESFAGKKANALDAARIATLKKFVEDSMKTLDVPGVSVGIVENGKTVFLGGFGVREMNKPAKVDGDTKFIIASNTKALTTLMLGKLVDEKKLSWETPVTELLPDFKLGNADTTSKVLVRHLICACTGMPRQDEEWILEYKNLTPAGVMKALGGMQPTSKFGELFQYSNVMAAAAGYVGGHVAFPRLELGKAYDDVMQTRVFAPLGMKSTTFDMAKGRRGNAAIPHGYDVNGKLAFPPKNMNNVLVPVRPAGGAWSSARDMLEYVKMELANGKLANGKTYLAKDTLLARRAPNVSIGKDTVYGMGLMVSTKYGTPVVHHGGDVFGFHSDMMWLPEANVGLVVLTNSDHGPVIRNAIQRKLLEVLFDGKSEADADVAAARKDIDASLEITKKQLVVPADAAQVSKLAAAYTSKELGDLTVIKTGPVTVFDFGEWKTEVATRKNPDGSVSFITIAPGISGLELVVGTGATRTLVMRDAQHEYTFTER